MRHIDPNSEDYQEFLQESDDLLREAEEAFLKIESGEKFPSHYDPIFRAFHSLKGASGMLELSALQDHMHKIETHFQSFKEHEFLSPDLCQYFLNAIDRCYSLLRNDEGEEFDYTLPEERKNKGNLNEEKKSNPIELKEKPLIYVVDDEKDIVFFLSERLKAIGYEVETFTDPRVVVSRIKQKVPNLVLSDFKMPKMSGIDLLKEVRSFQWKLPFIFVSAYLEKEILERAIKLNVSSVIDKPVKDEHLFPAVRNSILRAKMQDLANESINLLLYQFLEIEKTLLKYQETEIIGDIRKNLRSLLSSRRRLEQGLTD